MVAGSILDFGQAISTVDSVYHGIIQNIFNTSRNPIDAVIAS